jgi:hypothetical protein
MKVQVGIDIGSYTFVPATRTITLVGMPTLALEQLLLIVNTTRGIILYNFADSTLAATISSNIVVLSKDTTSMSAADRLNIVVQLSSPAAPGPGTSLALTSDSDAIIGPPLSPQVDYWLQCIGGEGVCFRCTGSGGANTAAITDRYLAPGQSWRIRTTVTGLYTHVIKRVAGTANATIIRSRDDGTADT